MPEIQKDQKAIDKQLPSHAKDVVIGGGVVSCVQFAFSIMRGSTRLLLPPPSLEVHATLVSDLSAAYTVVTLSGVRREGLATLCAAARAAEHRLGAGAAGRRPQPKLVQCFEKCASSRSVVANAPECGGQPLHLSLRARARLVESPVTWF